MRKFMLSALALCWLTGCNGGDSTVGGSSDKAATGQSSAAVEPEVEFAADPGTPFTIMHKDSIQYQGYVALIEPTAIRFAIQNEARESVSPHIASATISIPAISVVDVPGEPNDMNQYFFVKLPQPITVPTSVSLNFKVAGSDEAHGIDLLLR